MSVSNEDRIEIAKHVVREIEAVLQQEKRAEANLDTSKARIVNILFDFPKRSSMAISVWLIATDSVATCNVRFDPEIGSAQTPALARSRLRRRNGLS